jgi:hypothetical protein
VGDFAITLLGNREHEGAFQALNLFLAQKIWEGYILDEIYN